MNKKTRQTKLFGTNNICTMQIEKYMIQMQNTEYKSKL